MKPLSKPVIAIGIFLVVAAIVVFRIAANNPGTDPRRQNIPLVRVEQPLKETVAYQLQFTGDVAAIQQANIFSKVTGNIERVYIDMGSEVRRGQILAVVDSTELYQQVQQTAATFSNAKVNYRRTLQLFAQNLVAKQDVDNAEAQMKVAQANYETARARLGYARITAPFSGIITKRYLDPGALVGSANATIFTIMDLDSVKVIVNVLEKDVPLITIGKKAVIMVDAFPGREYEGRVSRLSQAVDLSTRTMAVEIGIPNSNHGLKPGMFATVTLILSERPNSVTVPTYAILTDANGIFVYGIENGVAKKIPVTIGVEQGSRTEVLSGLNGSEIIITTGQQFVRDGSPVSIQQ